MAEQRAAAAAAAANAGEDSEAEQRTAADKDEPKDEGKEKEKEERKKIKRDEEREPQDAEELRDEIYAKTNEVFESDEENTSDEGGESRISLEDDSPMTRGDKRTTVGVRWDEDSEDSDDYDDSDSEEDYNDDPFYGGMWPVQPGKVRMEKEHAHGFVNAYDSLR